MDSKYYHQIDPFLYGELSDQEEQELQEAINKDKALAKEVQLRRIEHIALDTMLEQDILAEVESYRQEIEEEKTPLKTNSKVRTLRPWWHYAVAASISFLVLGMAYQLFFARENSKQIALMTYAEGSLPTDIINIRGITDNNNILNKNLSAGKSFFDHGKYKKAASAFEAIRPDNAHYEIAQRLLAHSYFRLKQFDKAIETFEGIITRTEINDISHQNAEWYLLLSYLADEQQGKEFDGLMNTIINNKNHNQNRKAIQLREKL